MRNVIFEFLLKYNKINHLIWIFKWFPFVLSKNNNDNLWHLGCKYQSMKVLECAKKLNQDINGFNKRGLAPIHSLIESSFYLDKKSNKINFFMDLEVIEYFLSFNPQINLAWQKIRTEEQQRRVFSKNDISGTAIEILVMLFWDNILVKGREDFLSFYPLYEKIFLLLCKNGANVNFLFEGEDFGKEDVIQDAMQKLNNRIMSHFFLKYIDCTRDLYAIIPFLKNETTDFNIVSETKENILHIFFSRVSRRDHLIDKETAIRVMKDICVNPAFNESALKQKNNFFTTPLDCFKDEDYKKIFTSYIMQNKLENVLALKKEFPQKVKKL